MSDGQETSGDGQETSGDGQETSGDGQETSGDGQETSGDGQKIQANIKQTQQIYEDVAALLSTAERLMEKHGWIAANNSATTGVSGVIDKPRAWFPFAAFRIFANDQHPKLLTFVCVLLNDEPEGQFTVSEPIATAGVLYFEEDVMKTEKWEQWYAWWYGWASDFNTEHSEFEGAKVWKGLDDSWYKKWKAEAGRDLSRGIRGPTS